MRKNIYSFIALVVTASFFSGCTTYDGRPMVSTYNPPSEHKLKSITHWDIIANDVATQIQDTLQPPQPLNQIDQSDSKQSLKPISHQAVFISSPNSTDFDKVFSSQLKSSLLAKGFDVKSNPKDALVINFKVNSVYHVPTKRSSDYVPGTLTALAAGVLVIRDTALYNATTSGIVATTLGIAGAADLYALWVDMNKRPNTEIALTTTAEAGDKYIIHRTDSYYIDTVDTGLFTVSKSKEFDVVTGVKK